MSDELLKSRPCKEERPDPEALLARYHLRDHDLATHSEAGGEREQRKRGHLCVYLGAAAGVGKTYAMLAAGRRSLADGKDVVVGFVETHRRPHTQEQLNALEVIPRKKISYRGIELEEMDPEAILARHPQEVLIDELAHTNVVGSKHAKRYQDVQDILAAGIDVTTTLNIQHLESLSHVVEQITGIRVRETVPDPVLNQADEVELVDLAPEALCQRLKQGNVYPRELIADALTHFFREGNLTALRELTLRWMEEQTESHLQQYLIQHAISHPWPTVERVLVVFDHRPHMRQVIREAWRLAHGLRADFLAIATQPRRRQDWIGRLITFLDQSKAFSCPGENAQSYLEEQEHLAEDLGAEVMHASSNDLTQELVEIIQKQCITQLVLSYPTQSRWDAIQQSFMLRHLMRLSSFLQIHLVPQGRRA
jgi:two-component system sensor histidine kinase KdpD